MRRGRRLPRLELSLEQRSTLQGWTRRRKTAQALSMRARIVLRASEGLTATAIAAEVQACIQTVSKWWRRFDERGLDGLLDEPRPGQPRKLSDAQIEEVIVRTLESKPPAATHWSTRTMAQATGLNQTAISRIWRFFFGPASLRDVQIIQRPFVHRPGARHRGAPYESSAARVGLMRR